MFASKSQKEYSESYKWINNPLKKSKILTANFVLLLSYSLTNAHLNITSRISFNASGYYVIRKLKASIHSTCNLKSFENILAQNEDPNAYDVYYFNLSIWSPLMSSS